jgi:prepilin-type N-terminal cleavage/methylation domain-containing protein
VSRSQSGFSLVEVLVAVMILGVGVTALVGSSSMTTRMIGRGKSQTQVAGVASRRLEALRVAAYSTSPRCTSAGFTSGGPVTTGTITENWVVPPAGRVRNVQVSVTYRTARGPRTASLQTRIEC